MWIPAVTQRTARALRACSAAAALAACGLANAGGAAQVSDATGAIARAQEGATSAVEQRLRGELQAVMTELIESGAFGATAPQQIALAVDTPAQRVSNLGLLVDSGGAQPDGLHVLGVTPGSTAERMGLRGGDVLAALNGTSLKGPEAASTLRHAVDALPDGSRLAFDVQRDGRRQEISGTSSSVYLPAMRLTVGAGTAVASNAGAAAAGAAPARQTRDEPAQGGAAASSGCGRISDFDVAPRQEQLHAARIVMIDGVTPGPSGSRSFRVAAGPHEVKVAEAIESRYISFSDTQRNNRVNRYKTITVDVAPDTTTLVAARLNVDRRSVWQDGAYWDPVAWKQYAESCR